MIRVLLADDHTVVRQGLKVLLTSCGDIEVVGEAQNGRQAVQLAEQLLPDVAVIDVAMPVLNGLDTTRQIRRAAPAAKVLILSSYSEDDYVQQAIDAGASGYLVKLTAAEELGNAIRTVRGGHEFFSPAIVQRLRARGRERVPAAGPSKRRTDYLTAREAEVLQLIAEGRRNKQIATELGISMKTVEKHRQQVMNKLGIHDSAGLTRHAISQGMVEAHAGFGSETQ